MDKEFRWVTYFPPLGVTVVRKRVGTIRSVSELPFDPDANITFESWFKRYEDIFKLIFLNMMTLQRLEVYYEKLKQLNMKGIGKGCFKECIGHPNQNFWNYRMYFSIL